MHLRTKKRRQCSYRGNFLFPTRTGFSHTDEQEETKRLVLWFLKLGLVSKSRSPQTLLTQQSLRAMYTDLGQPRQLNDSRNLNYLIISNRPDSPSDLTCHKHSLLTKEAESKLAGISHRAGSSWLV